MAGTARGVGESPYSQAQWAELQATAAPARPPRTYAQRRDYPSIAGIVVVTLLLAVPFVSWVAIFIDIWMIARYIFGYRSPGSPTWSIHHPSVVSLVVVWILAPFTGVAFPFAIYMTFRFILEFTRRRADATKTCTRCAEKIKAAALVCRYCGQEFEAPVVPVAQPPAPEAQRFATVPPPAPPAPFTAHWMSLPAPVIEVPSTSAETADSADRSPRVNGFAFALGFLGLVGLGILTYAGALFVGSQVRTTPGSVAHATTAPAPTARVIATTAPAAAPWPPAGFTTYNTTLPVAFRWLEQGEYSCQPGQTNGCMGIEVRWQGTCSTLSVAMDTLDGAGASTGVATGTGHYTGTFARLIVAMPSPAVKQIASLPRISCD